MPAKSKKQFGLMQAIAQGTPPKGLGGPPQSVAQEFVDETPTDKKSKFAKALKRGKKVNASL